MKKIISILVFSIFFCTEVWAQTLLAKTSRTDLPEGEAFLLTLDYDGNDSAAPELNVLDKDFTVYSVTNSYQTNIINGQVSQRRQWQIGLMPKAVAGTTITIPSIKLGNTQSNPIQIRILDAQSLANPNNSNNPNYQEPRKGPRFAVRGEVDNPTPYVQQQVNYILTLLDAGGLQGGAPEVVDEGKNDWLIRSLGEPEVSSKIVNGRSLREIKFHYAMFPQKSGLLKTPVFRFNGYYLTQNGRGADPFDDFFGGSFFDSGIGFGGMFATRNPVVLNTKPIDIEVKPVPAENKGSWWLPAENVRLYAEWNPKQPTFKVGEAVSRTIYLKAVGVLESQLPDVDFVEANGLRQYPEKPEAQNGIEHGQVVGVKKITNVYIPDKSGNITVPEVSVNWFNVKTGKMERAVLPAVNINVEAGNQIEPQKTIPAEPVVNEPEQIAAPQAEKQDPMPMSAENRPTSNPWNIYTLLLAFVMGMLISWFLFRRPAKSVNGETKPNLKEAHKEVIRAAKENNFRALRDALLIWAQQKFKNQRINNLNDVIKAVNSKDFEKQAEIITAELYGSGGKDWNADAFIKIFEKADAKRTSATEDDKPLPKLYKN